MKRVAGAMAVAIVALVSPFVPAAVAQAVIEPSLVARAGTQDSLVASWQIDRNSAAGPGYGFSIDWIRQLDAGRVMTAGASSFAVGESRWTLGRFGWAFRPRERLTLSAQTTLGGGTTGSSLFGHRTVRGDLVIRAADKASILLGDEYINVAGAHGQVLRAGGAVRVSRLVMVEGTQAGTTGNLNTTLSMARFELLTRVSVVGGGVFGRVTPELVALTGSPAEAGQRLREGFVGVGFPLGPTTSRLTFDVMSLGEVTRRTLTLTAAIPVRR